MEVWEGEDEGGGGVEVVAEPAVTCDCWEFGESVMVVVGGAPRCDTVLGRMVGGGVAVWSVRKSSSSSGVMSFLSLSLTDTATSLMSDGLRQEKENKN